MGLMSAPQRSNWFGLMPRRDGVYVCTDCGRDVDADLEVSPGESDHVCWNCWDVANEVCS
jgi:hypothetical protein